MTNENPAKLERHIALLAWQNFALRQVVGEIFVEIAMMTDQPAVTLDRLNARITGLAAGVAARVPDPSPLDVETTRVMESIQSMAESSLRERLAKGPR